MDDLTPQPEFATGGVSGDVPLAARALLRAVDAAKAEEERRDGEAKTGDGLTDPTPQTDPAFVRWCKPVHGSCALLSDHKGPHHGYPDDIRRAAKALRSATADARLTAVIAAIPADCWVTQEDEASCADLIGSTFPQGYPMTWEMACLPCRVRNALFTALPDTDRRDLRIVLWEERFDNGTVIPKHRRGDPARDDAGSEQ